MISPSLKMNKFWCWLEIFIKVKMPSSIWALSHRKQTLLRNLPKAQGEPLKFVHVLLPHTVHDAMMTAQQHCFPNQFFKFEKKCFSNNNQPKPNAMMGRHFPKSILRIFGYDRKFQFAQNDNAKCRACISKIR